jgi:Uma2 family endonuclease
MTADEFLRAHGDESGVELVRGRLVRSPMPGALHGQVCVKATLIFGNFIEANGLGRLMSHDTFVRTRTDPDTFLGADHCFISYETLPADRPTPVGPLVPPLELVIEVRSPSNSIADLTEKAADYIRAGVRVVVVLDPQTESAAVFRADELPQRFHNGDELALPDVLPGFAVPVRKFFGR